MSLTLALAWVLPWAAGAAAYCALSAPRGAGWTASALGHGLVLGMLLAALGCDAFARADTTHAFARTAIPLLVVALACAAIAWRRWRIAPVAAESIEVAVPMWQRALLCLAMLSLLWRAWIAAREILLRPTFPWDAWDAWAVKSKTWFLLGHYVPFESMHDWLTKPSEIYSGAAWSYPPGLAWLQVWFASAAGAWIEPVVNLPWLVLWLGLLLAHYGQWRALGVERKVALLFVYFLGSLPLLTVHVALAGYADLWVAALFGLAVLAWLRWREQRDRGQLLLACVCAAALPWLKHEGAVWLLLFAGWAVYGSLPRRWRRWTLGGFVFVAALVAAIDRMMLPLFGLGWVSIGLTSIWVPVIGTLAIGWHSSALAGFASSLFAQPNWHLLWWLLPVLVIWRWRALRAEHTLRTLGALLLGAFGFLTFLFLFTDAARWAESYTAVNRLLMHLVPATLTFAVLLCRGWHAARPDTAPAFAAPLDPA